MKKRIAVVIVILFVISGCATTGPKVSYDEIRKAEDELRLKALKFQSEQLARVTNIGYTILQNLPQEDRRGNYPFVGIYYARVNRDYARLYNLRGEGGVVITVSIKNSPADKAGLAAGDVIRKIDGKKIKSVSEVEYHINRAKPGEILKFEIGRNGEELQKEIAVGGIPRKIVFEMDTSDSVNAGATHNKVIVTYGLTRFTKSDDEIAVIIGHELAHLTKGHLEKSMAGQAVGMVAAIGLGVLSEMASPGTGATVARAVGGIGDAFGRVYSQDLEREADYFGIQYVYLAGYDIDAGMQFEERFAIEVPKTMVRDFLATHPSSPERYVRIKKAIEEIKSKDAKTMIGGFPDSAFKEGKAKK